LTKFQYIITLFYDYLYSFSKFGKVHLKKERGYNFEFLVVALTREKKEIWAWLGENDVTERWAYPSKPTKKEEEIVKILKMTVKTALITILFVAAICGSALADEGAYTGAFPDVSLDSDYGEAVEALYDMGIFGGDEDGNFNPNNTITRAEVATVICRLLGVEEEAKSMKTQVFSDLPASHWAAGYVAKAAELGIVNGYENGKFGPEDPVTYEQMVKMLVCAAGYGEDAESAGGYPDGYLAVGDECGFTSGVNIVIGKGAPRSAVAMLVYNAIQK
jgi:hypothetical protein